MKEFYGAEIEIGKSLLDYHTVEQDRVKAKENIDRVFVTGETLPVEDSAGPIGALQRFFEISHNPVRDANGKVISVAIFAKDVTQHKQLEELQQ
jgi:PAS domain S-box-containing protein